MSKPNRIKAQLESLLRSAQSLDNEPTNELTIARMKFIQARLTVLTRLQARRDSAKIRKLKDEVDRLRIENERLMRQHDDDIAETARLRHVGPRNDETFEEKTARLLKTFDSPDQKGQTP